MAKLISLSIDVNKITKEKLYKGQKGTYLNLTIALNDEKDQYGNDVSCWEKCEKDEQKNFLGNGKVFWGKESSVNKETTSTQQKKDIEEEDDTLPF